MSEHVVSMKLNTQQVDLLQRTVAEGWGEDITALARRALREQGQAARARPAPASPDLDGLSTAREKLFEHVMQPGTGKALELRAGQVLRIEQVEGAQCVDFNCFNLHDYKEFMHCGRIRTVHGLNPGPGDFLWSAPPRERAMLLMLEDTVRCNDVMFPRCSAYLYESAYGFHDHTNCHDIQAEAQREYGLTPDDVHDSFNLFMCTEVKGDRGVVRRQHSKAGDFIEFLALMDVLAVPNVCGSDVMRTSNFALKPVKLEVYGASVRDLARVPELPRYANQKTPENFKIPQIKATRALQRDPGYTPQFTNVPLQQREWPIALDAEDYARLQSAGLGELYDGVDGDALRDVLFSWWEREHL
ncbi:MAG TPA: urea carboxylase-associated family protein [Burkholderiaceae bacterium]|jgi:hypothetical protein